MGMPGLHGRSASLIESVMLVGCLAVPSVAAAQIGSPCLRPLAIPDRWEEQQSAPWDQQDTFDRYNQQGGVIANPDVYRPPGDTAPTGFVPETDQGRYFELRLGSPVFPAHAGFAFAVTLGEAGGSNFHDNIVQCAGVLVETGDTLPAEPGNLIGPFLAGFTNLIEQDPNAQWDPTANDNRGGVVGSAFAVSPRLIAFAVYDPDVYAQGLAVGRVNLTMVRIVGFFVAGLSNQVVQGYLTGWSSLSTEPVSIIFGESATLASTLDGPGAPLSGVPVDFAHGGISLGAALTGLDGRAQLSGVEFPGLDAGVYDDAIVASLGTESGFFSAAPSAADLTIAKAATSVDLTSSVNPSRAGDPVTLTALVAVVAPGGGVPTGLVDFLRGNQVIGTVALNNASATFITNPLSAGKIKFTARYRGTINHAASTSAQLIQTVKGGKK